ncbi:carbamoyltransferase HypF [Nocardiopsis listeri]|uniref:carbamoyltransferase HypF n=1 Tax=Nocardiopsis listeri TaxID=53440 RepID=UPI000A03F507|nr:carbamoyltransferase HypF [Nocardiopsis listeri]
MQSTTNIVRRRIFVRGIVQGVGFRPFVYQEAQRHRLNGFVGNDSDGVFIEVEGKGTDLAAFIVRLRNHPPPLARVDRVVDEPMELRHDCEFSISRSRQGRDGRNTLISPDSALCEQCHAELLTPTDRRHRYPFINCTNCGPRFTITMDVPYDRVNTTMLDFPLCSRCATEYDTPSDRRFHAQPNACPDCGPNLEFLRWTRPDGDGNLRQAVADGSLAQAADLLARGGVLAVKGLGGFHLACDAGNPKAVAELRRRKNREARPLAVMVEDVTVARSMCVMSAEEEELLRSVQRPIVLLRRLLEQEQGTIMEGVAPGVGTLGVMLPYTPVHHLLLASCREHFPRESPVALVMTSANASDDPIIYHDEEASALLPDIADAVLTNNRPIHMRCDDSLVRITAGSPQVLRRARGYAPAPLRLALSSPVPLLACGANNKNTFCLVEHDQAFVSHHIGKLSTDATLRSFAETVEHYQRLFDVMPAVVVHDLHPHYGSTRYAHQSAVPLKIGVQHHEAHIASVIAEHGLEGPLIGVAADGTGYGPDGTIWGGEFFVGDLKGFERFAHLAQVPLPGGGRALAHPWMLGYVYLREAFGADTDTVAVPLLRELSPDKSSALDRLIADPAVSPRTSSMGRLFDAVSAILGICDENQYEGQAAVMLEEAALLHVPEREALPVLSDPSWGTSPSYIGPIETRPMVQGVVDDMSAGVPVPEIAFRFHHAVAGLITSCCEAARHIHGHGRVALSGGVFQNALLLELVTVSLRERGFAVYKNTSVPCHDGGIALGQAAVAAARLENLAAPARSRAGEGSVPTPLF